MADTNSDERTPLVGSGPLYRDPSLDSPNQPASAGVTWRRYIWYIIILVLTQIASSIAGAPYLRLLESVVCKNYYDENDPSVIEQDGMIPENYCKKASIQEAVALIQTLQQLFNFFGGLLASFHTSIMLRSHGRGFKLHLCDIERRSGGRRFVLTLNLIAFLCTLILKYSILHFEPKAVQWTWVSAVFLLVAGGPEWRSEIIFMMIGDATSKGRNFQNTYTVIAFQQAAAGIAGWGSIHLAAQLMTGFGVWVPLNIGLGIILFVILLLQFVPMDEPSANRGNYSSRYQAFISRLRETFNFLRGSATSIWLLISTYLVSSTFPQLVDNSLFEQYISTRFKNTIAKASQLQANSTVMNSVVLIFSVFLLGKLNGSRFLKYWGWMGLFTDLNPVKDIYISRGTAIAQSVGFAMIGFSTSYPGVISGLAFCAFGQPFRIATRCALLYMTYLPGQDTITGLFSIITFVDMLSGTVVNLLLTLVFNRSLKLRGTWVGLPFFLAAFLLAIVAVIVFSVNVTPAQTLESSGSSTLEADNSAMSTSRPGTPLEAPKSPDVTYQEDPLVFEMG